MSELTPKKKGIFREYGEALLVALLVAAFIRLFLVSVFTIPSGSMLDTIQIGDYILVNKLSYGLKLPFSNTWIYKAEGPQYGDIIVFKYPKNPSVDYIKRVVGLPGVIIETNISAWGTIGTILKIPVHGALSAVKKFTARHGAFTGLGTVKTILCVLAA